VSYPCCRITPHPCRRRILVVYRRIINVFVSSSSSSSSSLLSSSSLYPRHRRRCCRIHVVCTAVVNWPIWPCLSFSLVMFVRCHDLITKSHHVIQPCYVHARRRHVSPFIAPRRYYCLSFLPLHHPLIVGCCVIHVVCVSFMSVILPRMIPYRQLTTYMLPAVGKPAPRMAPSKWTWSGMYKLSPVPV